VPPPSGRACPVTVRLGATAFRAACWLRCPRRRFPVAITFRASLLCPGVPWCRTPVVVHAFRAKMGREYAK